MRYMYRPMTRKSFLANGGKAIIGASLAGTLLAGCGGKRAVPEILRTGALSRAQDRVNTTRSTSRSRSKANPGIDLKVQFQSPEDLDRTIRTALQGGEGRIW